MDGIPGHSGLTAQEVLNMFLLHATLALGVFLVCLTIRHKTLIKQDSSNDRLN